MGGDCNLGIDLLFHSDLVIVNIHRLVVVLHVIVLVIVHILRNIGTEAFAPGLPVIVA